MSFPSSVRGARSGRARAAASLTAAAAALTLALAGCSTGDSDSASSDAPSTAAAEFPRTVTHSLGESVIPEQPTRVVAASDGEELDLLLALGVVPVQVGQRNPDFWPWASDALEELGGETPELVDVADFQLSLEGIASADPDLIVSQANLIEDDYDAASKIAPVIPVVVDEDWRTSIAMLGEALGLEDTAASVTQQADEDLDAAHQETDLSGVTVGIISAGYTPGLFNLYAGSGQSEFIEGFGATNVIPDFVADASPEQVGLLNDADVIVVFNYGLEGTDPAESPLFQSLPAVQAGHVVTLTEAESQSLAFENPLRQPYAIDVVAKIAAAAA